MVTRATKQKIKDGFESAFAIGTLFFMVGGLICIGCLGGNIGQHYGISFVSGFLIAEGAFFSLVGIILGLLLFKNWLDED